MGDHQAGGPSYSLPLAQLHRGEEPRFGAKSANLGELLASGIPVPGGFALCTAAFEAFITESGLAAAFERRLASVEIDDLGEVDRACAAVAEAIRAAPVPEAVAAEIDRGCEELARDAGEPAPPLAVRSSAIGEDSHTATFAGQQETFLWVRGAEAVVGAVRDCWASLYSTTAVSYRARAGQTDQTPTMGVTIQLMVDAEVSGVMFTINPVSGDPSVVAINASWGLGEAVVGGEVTPDEYLLSKVTGEVVRQRIGDKRVQRVPAPAGAGTCRRDVAPELRDVACLSAGELADLLGVARRIQSAFGCHQDIEWAIARDRALTNRLFVLQSRPVTAAFKPPSRPAAGDAIGLVMSTFGAGAETSPGRS